MSIYPSIGLSVGMHLWPGQKGDRTHTHVHTNTYTQTYTHINTYIHTQTHTHTHTLGSTHAGTHQYLKTYVLKREMNHSQRFVCNIVKENVTFQGIYNNYEYMNDVWMNEWTNERTNEWMSEWVSEWASERVVKKHNAVCQMYFGKQGITYILIVSPTCFEC